MKMPGLVKGLAVTLGTMGRRSVTQQYPDVKPELPPRSRGVIALLEENCTVCMLCARECPDWCIYIDSHKETIPAPPGGRERQRNVLDRFAIDFSLCMYCGICIEACPFDALFWSPEFEYAELDIRDLMHGKERLGGWKGPFGLDAQLGWLWTLLKIFAVSFVVIWLRVSYPRLREDQLQRLAWQGLVPVALGQLALTGVVAVAIS